MRNLLTLALSCCLLAVLAIDKVQAAGLGDKMKGRILLQVEAKGEAWYVDPGSSQRYYLGRPADAFEVMRKLGLGISNADFEKMKDKVPARLAGRILVKVQDKGQAYYADPVGLKLHYLGRPSDAFRVMRSLGLGISNHNLKSIKAVETKGGTDSPVIIVTPPAAATTTDDDKGPVSTEEGAPGIAAISVADGSDKGYIDEGDIITVTFDEEIDPKSINASLDKGGSVSGVYHYKTGGVSISAAGLVTIANIASFDLGTAEGFSNFITKVALDSSGKTLTVTLLDGTDLAIMTELFANPVQTGGTVKDREGKAMKAGVAGKVSGTFGGEYGDDSGTPYITAIKAINGGSSGIVDADDSIIITFNEAIDPTSINGGLKKGSNIADVPYSSTGGVSISTTGKVTVKNIATFDLGSVRSAGTFISRIAMNSTGKTLTIDLVSGNDVAVTGENFSDANQIGGIIKDEGGKAMVTLTDIANPTGTFGGAAEGDASGPHISSISVANNGDQGYIDTADVITITFNETMDSASINEDLESGSYITGVPSTMTGGVSVSSAGYVTIRNIVSFDMGSVANGGSFASKLALSSTGKILTITLTSGSDIKIVSESLNSSAQIGGTVKDSAGNAMASDGDIADPSGTFGGRYDADDATAPHITALRVANGGEAGYIDTGDTITITFDEKIDPASINNNLGEGSYVTGVFNTLTGGISISTAGKVTIRNIAVFDMGSVGAAGTFISKQALDASGMILTITLTSSGEIAVASENFGSVSQIGGTVKDVNGNLLESDSYACDPVGTFGG